MKKSFTTLIIIILFCFKAFIVKGQEANQSHKDSLKMIVNEYYKLNIKVFQSNSTVDDIDNIFKLFSEDFTYVHPKYGGVYTRKKLYEGYVRNQKNGGYNGSVADIKIVNTILGLNAVVVEKKFISKTDTGTEAGKPQMTLFEFKEGKIFKIFEYW
ncbi:nuclear transport factor 2 family protein [Aquimarina sp. 2201CG5-10]|uniref:nuclear transport factor 2 family protein n=1 Tax=Aquimarina callyspongiae TaxID=3098150 RepID=UPI002AB3C02A|nr:nuclear transport factor 2 family protein [Aquimarina sp. 2201CG5-10]MDY8136558.1 nuclear transport factor 2 family protein [Aquimarina sp. 2201CG5-10]